MRKGNSGKYQGQAFLFEPQRVNGKLFQKESQLHGPHLLETNLGFLLAKRSFGYPVFLRPTSPKERPHGIPTVAGPQWSSVDFRLRLRFLKRKNMSSFRSMLSFGVFTFLWGC